MKNLSLLIILLLTFIIGCKDIEPDARELPTITTSAPTAVDETGATFQGEIVTEGKLTASSYGFVWGIKDQMVESSNKIILTENPASSKFSIRIDHALAKDVEYKLRAFATVGNTTVYGNSLSFTSKGSNQNGWTILNPEFNIGGPVFSSSDDNYGYIFYSSSKAVRFDPATNQISGIEDFPDRYYDVPKFTSVASGKNQYFMYNLLYRLTDGKWSAESMIPFQYYGFSGYYQGLSVNNRIYFLSSYESFMFDLNSNTWERKAKLPIVGAYSNGGTTLNGKAYVITSDKSLWEYNPDTDKWIIINQYPGTLGDRLVSFSFNGRLYFGISSVGTAPNILADKRLWSFDLGLNKWIAMEEFPADHNYGTIFYFFLKGELYVSMGNSDNANNSTLWKYDPSKMKN